MDLSDGDLASIERVRAALQREARRGGRLVLLWDVMDGVLRERLADDSAQRGAQAPPSCPPPAAIAG